MVTVLRFANVLGDPPDHADQPQPVPASLPVHLRLRPAPAVRRGGRRRAGAAARHPGRHPRSLQRGGATGGSPGARWPASAARGSSPLSPFSPLKIRPLARLFDLPAELEDLLRYGRGVDTRRFAATGFSYNATSAGAVQSFIRALRLRRQSGQVRRARTPTSTTWSSSSATPRRSSAPARPDAQSASHSATSSASRPAHSSAVMRVAHVVLPHAVDLEEALGDPFFTDAELLDHPPAGHVPRDDGDLHPVQRDRLEGEAQA